MSKPNILETGVLGLLLGSALSAYITYLIGSGATIGRILEFVSLRPVLEHILSTYGQNISNTITLSITFAFFLVVFTLYGTLIGIAIKFVTSTKYIVIALVIITIIITGEHVIRSKRLVSSVENHDLPALVMKSRERKPEKFFGMEAYGDLSQDGKDDVAFIISRKDAERGMLYYLTSAISSTDGHEGTNLIFLGDKNKPEKIRIENQNVIIELSSETGEKTNLYAELIGNDLVKIEDATQEASTPNPSR